MRKPVLVVLAIAALVACHRSHVRSHVAGGVLGRVVIYRNGVAFYERHARLEDGRVEVRVPRERVDDFLKSLTVVDRATGEPLAVSIPRTQDSSGTYLTMTLETSSARPSGEVLLTYVTEAPAWKPSYRVVVGDGGKVMLEAWAVVDNTTSEDWRDVLVGVGASSALSFRYDLWSVRRVNRDLLQSDDRFAVAPPIGLSPYADGTGEELATLDGATVPVSFSGTTSQENQYIVEGVNATSRGTAIEGVVQDAAGQPAPGVTVTASRPGVPAQSTLTDAKGRYRIAAAPGRYDVTFYYGDARVTRQAIAVAADKVAAVNQRMPRPRGGETIALASTPVPRRVVQNVPVGRTFQAALGSAAGSTGDGGGSRIATPQPQPPQPVLSGDRLKAIVAKVTRDRRDVVVEVRGAPGTEAEAFARGTTVKHRLVDAGIAAGKIRVVPKLGAGERETIRVLAVAPRARPEAAGGRAARDGDDTPVGESHFMAERPMTVRAGSSAMVSLVRGETPGGVVYLYDPISERGDARYAFKAVRLDNPTDDTLESGPVTVYGDGRFIGEGITEPIPPHAVAVIPFALDKQIVVTREADEADRIAKLVTVERGVLTAEVQHRRDTKLAITSRLATPAVIYLRHRLESGWTLVEHPGDVTRVGDSHLFRVELAPRETAHVVISEATPVERTFDLGSETTLGMMKVFLADPDASDELRGQVDALLATRRAGAELNDRIATLRDQIAEYRSRSGELHAQIVTLKAVRSGGDLMTALRRKLAEMSSRTQRATIALVEAQEQLMLARVKLQNQLAELHLTDATAARHHTEP